MRAWLSLRPIAGRPLVAGCFLAVSLTSIAHGQCVLPNDDGDPTYGESVAVSAYTTMVGSANGVNVFRFDGAAWPTDQYLPTPDDCSPSCGFGRYVAMDGDVAVVGASLDDDNGNNSGSAYVFRWDGSSWVQEAKLLPADGAAEEYFGNSVAISGDVAIAASPNAEAVFIFRYDGSTWAEEQKLENPGMIEDIFGEDVAITRGTIFVGASR